MVYPIIAAIFRKLNLHLSKRISTWQFVFGKHIPKPKHIESTLRPLVDKDGSVGGLGGGRCGREELSCSQGDRLR